MTLLILFGTLTGIIVSIVIGTLWHSPFSPFGKIHMEYLGFTKLSKEEQAKKIEEAKPHMWKIYLKQIVLSGITSAALAYLLITLPKEASISVVYISITALWVAFIAPLVGQNLLWGPCADEKLQLKKFFGDSLYQIITYSSIIFILSLFI
jgi:hypothetical protein